MEIKITDNQVYRTELPLDVELAHRLDVFAAALSVLKMGRETPDMESLRQGLTALVDLFKGKGSFSVRTNWTARFYPSPSNNGGTLNLDDYAIKQQVVVCRDHKGAFYSGVWSHWVTPEAVEGLLFGVISSLDGYRFEVSDGSLQRSCQLGRDLGELVWAPPGAIEEILPEGVANRLVRKPTFTAPLKPYDTAPVKDRRESAPDSQAAKTNRLVMPPALREVPEEVVRPQPLQPQPETGTPILLLIRQADGVIFPVKDRFAIGRDRENNLCLPDKEISRRHAVIEPVPGGWQISDLNSTNGIWLNGVRVQGTARIKAGDILDLGKTKLRLDITYR
jgi:hypothetical protein